MVYKDYVNDGGSPVRLCYKFLVTNWIICRYSCLLTFFWAVCVCATTIFMLAHPMGRPFLSSIHVEFSFSVEATINKHVAQHSDSKRLWQALSLYAAAQVPTTPLLQESQYVRKS